MIFPPPPLLLLRLLLFLPLLLPFFLSLASSSFAHPPLRLCAFACRRLYCSVCDGFLSSCCSARTRNTAHARTCEYFERLDKDVDCDRLLIVVVSFHLTFRSEPRLIRNVLPPSHSQFGSYRWAIAAVCTQGCSADECFSVRALCE